MTKPPPKFDEKDPREVVVLTFDASPMLPEGVTLIGTPQVVVSTLDGADNPPSLTLGTPLINASALTIPATETFAGRTIAIGAAVQVPASSGGFSSEYLINVICSTSDTPGVIVLKATLPMTSA